jgi:hypothetical protein
MSWRYPHSCSASCSLEHMCICVVVLVMSEWQKGRKRVVRNVSLWSGFLCYIMSFFYLPAYIVDDNPNVTALAPSPTAHSVPRGWLSAKRWFCRGSRPADGPTLGKGCSAVSTSVPSAALGKEILCRGPDKKPSAKPETLGKAWVSCSDSFLSKNTNARLALLLVYLYRMGAQMLWWPQPVLIVLEYKWMAHLSSST